MTLTRAIGKSAAWIVGIVAVLIAAAGVFLFTFDWNRAKPWVNEQVSAALGRPFAINGDIKVGWRRPDGETGWRAWVPWPSFSATQIEIGNPDWAKSPKFATLDAAHFDLAILPLLAHEIVIPSIDVVNPAIDLERLADGRNTWTFQFKQSSQPSTWKVRLDSFGFAKGTVVYRDAITKADLTVAIDTLGQPIPLGDVLKEQEQTSRAASAQRVGKRGAAQLSAKANAEAASSASAAQAASGASSAVVAAAASAASAASASKAAPASKTAAASGASGAAAPAAKPAGPTYAFGLKVDGRYKNVPINGTGKIGGVLAVQNATQPFPLQADVKAGDTRLAIVGTLTDPMHLAALDLRLWLQGTSMSHLYALTGITLPDTPPYATEGRLIGNFKPHASTFRYENFNGRVGGSDLGGTLTYAQRQPRPKLSGELVSNLLQFSDLAPVIGADTAASKAKRGDTTHQPPGRVLPVETFRTDRWRALDADVKFTGRKLIKSANLPVTNLYTHIVMQDGVLSLEPLQFGVAGGTLATTAHLDGSGAPLKGRFTVAARHLKLKQLFPTQKVMQSALGEINGDASLSATGNSPAALAATSNGEVKALVTDGRISRLLMEAAGLNVANVVYEKLFGNNDVKINCAAIDFVATNGILDPKVFALDTDDALINVDGPISLRDETLNLKIHPHTKGFRIFSLRSPLYAKGTFKNPDVGVDAGALALRAGAMVGLGLINPFAALIPLIAPSNNKDVPCSTLFGQMNAKAAQRAAAKAGK
ncbi:cell envelope biogenesis protein AsmA [Burkholderia pseudomultivorans]|uniref:AsmA family protein n=1 Tax=Burkholderia pseudomultivorans TaxID=1207504 RepID=UPI0007547070|nr:AsmA family protein [Burkholderia pseudomultivorans]AOI92369.1 cell envelope biogenesis protein AsmA [Burkholderia pseudomultivorans]KVC22049.1 cell envelope biogenesis protein AsmA [Burkholderia pseudomultivorans]KVC29528.1 cell envelope biogenesis protein AsmA [Burkholderia pseudomultivorans]KVC51087.1 cell envelope biogenesis protein AsmA [Burkholderia pseudomultivorans]KWF09155.1 cell envelope biogenesis protein AsmA [Burkholderia pseudomultivorans]